MTDQTDSTESGGERIVVGVDGSAAAGMAIDPSVLSESAAAVLERELNLLQGTQAPCPLVIVPPPLTGNEGPVSAPRTLSRSQASTKRFLVATIAIAAITTTIADVAIIELT